MRSAATFGDVGAVQAPGMRESSMAASPARIIHEKSVNNPG